MPIQNKNSENSENNESVLEVPQSNQKIIFDYIARLKQKYRSYVHVFEREAGFGIHRVTEQRLGFPLEADYVSFLRQHNGVLFFQGHLQLLAFEEISFVSSKHPAMFVIAQGKLDTWAVVVEGLPTEMYTPEFRDLPLEEKVKRRRSIARDIDPTELRYVYGIWDGEQFTPLHDSFTGWLLSTLQVLDEKCEDLHTELSIRLEHDSTSPFVLSLLADISQLQATRLQSTSLSGSSEIILGQTQDNLCSMYDACLELYPTWPKMLCRKADLIDAKQPEIAQKLRMESFCHLQFPVVYLDLLPQEPNCVDQLFVYQGNLEEKKQLIEIMESFWEYRIFDVRNHQEFELVHRIVIQLAQFYKTSTNKHRGCDILQKFIQLVPNWSYQQSFPEISILLAEFLIDFGDHDKAEEVLQSIIHPPEHQQPFLYNYRAVALLQCAQIATYRQEPWCTYLFEEIESITTKEDVIGRFCTGYDILAHLYLLKAEYRASQSREDHLEEAIAFYKTSISYAQEAPQKNHFIEGSAYLGLGEIFVRQQKIGMVPQYYEKVQDILKEHPNEILTARMFLRRGFLELYTGQEEKSRQSYQLAIDTFDMLHMPLQKAWSLLRLAQAGSKLGKTISEEDRSMALRAQTLFYQLACPTGVSAVDRFLDQPQQSLAWHMKTAHELQKKLTRTRRCIAPYVRSDGERFERKLGAHRISIARCDEKIIPDLISEIREQAQILGDTYVSDVHVALMCFTTATEFLATNKSYEAARAMVDLMKEIPETGSVHIAFRNTLARTINMNVVEHLLEELSKFDNQVQNKRMLLFAAEILGFRREKDSIPHLISMLQSEFLQQDHHLKIAAILALGRIGVTTYTNEHHNIDVIDVLYSYLEKLENLTISDMSAVSKTIHMVQNDHENTAKKEEKQEEKQEEIQEEKQEEIQENKQEETKNNCVDMKNVVNEQEGKQSQQEALALALLLLGERKGLDTLAQMIEGKQFLLTRLFGEMVGRFGDSSYFMMLQKAALQEGIIGMGALVGLGFLGNPRAIPLLLENLVHLNPQIVHLSAHALELITGHHENLDDSRLRRRWLDWWEDNKMNFESGLRYRYGNLFGPEILISCLRHDSLLIRQHSYDELVIATGVKMHFDYDGPFQIQQRQIQKWENWWEENKEDFPSGRWFFQGK